MPERKKIVMKQKVTLARMAMGFLGRGHYYSIKQLKLSKLSTIISLSGLLKNLATAIEA